MPIDDARPAPLAAGAPRRRLLQLLASAPAAALLGAAMSPVARGAAARASSGLADSVRLRASSDGRPVAWWVRGTSQAVKPDGSFEPLFARDLFIVYAARPDGDGGWRVRAAEGSLVSELHDDRPAMRIRNPFDGREAAVPPSRVTRFELRLAPDGEARHAGSSRRSCSTAVPAGPTTAPRRSPVPVTWR